LSYHQLLPEISAKYSTTHQCFMLLSHLWHEPWMALQWKHCNARIWTEEHAVTQVQH